MMCIIKRRESGSVSVGSLSCRLVLFLAVLAAAVSVSAGEESIELPRTQAERERLSGREIRLLRRQMSSREAVAEAAFRNAETAFLIGEFDHAVEEFLSVAQEYDDTSYVLRATVRVGDVYYRQQNYPRAISYYQRALRVPSEPWWPEGSEDEYARADYMIGVCYFEQDELPMTFTHFRRFAQRYPESPLVDRAYDFIGRGNMQMERYGQAIEAFRMVGTARLEREERRTVAPGEDLYVRVIDEDMAVARGGEDITARLTTRTGDEEMLRLRSLGHGSPVFLNTIRVRLGPPRHTVELEEAFSPDVRRQIRRAFEDAERLREDADNLERTRLRELEDELRLVDRALRRLEEDPEADEEQLAEFRSRQEELGAETESVRTEIERIRTAADERENDAYGIFDGAVARIESVLEQWGVEQLDEEVASAEDIADADLSDVFTPAQIDAVRVNMKDEPTDGDNYAFRTAVVEYWYDQLLYEYKTLDVRGDDVISVEYIDPYGLGGEEVIHVDELTIASDGLLEIVGPDYERSVDMVVIGDRVRVRIEDPDMSRTDEQDTVTVVVASVPVMDDDEEEADEEPVEEPEEDGELPVTVVDPFAEEEEEERPPLVPEDTDHFVLELKETGPHSGIFVGSFPTVPASDNETAGNIEISSGYMIRIAYDDIYTGSYGEEGWTLVRKVGLIEPTEGRLDTIELQEGELDRYSQLDKAVAKGKLGTMYMELGFAEEATRTFDEAIEIARLLVEQEGQSPLGEEATYRMWDLYFRSGRDEAAARAANRLLSAFPDSPLADDALMIMGKAAGASDNPGAAMGHFSRLTRDYPNSPLAPEAQYLIAVTQENMPGHRGGFRVSAYESVVNRYPDTIYAAKSLLRLSQYYVENRDYERAVDYLDRIMFDFPDFADLDRATFMRGVCAYRLGNLHQAYRLMHEVIEKYPGTASANNAIRIAEVLARQIQR